jgi:hypothetical protein
MMKKIKVKHTYTCVGCKERITSNIPNNTLCLWCRAKQNSNKELMEAVK